MFSPISPQSPPASPSPSLRYEADDEAPTPFGDASNHTRRTTDPSKLAVASGVDAKNYNVAKNLPALALKERLRHREPQPSMNPAKQAATPPASVAMAARRLAETQLAEALKEIERLRAQVRTLEMARVESTRETEVTRSKKVTVDVDKEKRERERDQEDRLRKLSEANREEKAKREKAEADVRRLRIELNATKAKCAEADERAREEEKKRVAVELDLEKLAMSS